MNYSFKQHIGKLQDTCCVMLIVEQVYDYFFKISTIFLISACIKGYHPKIRVNQDMRHYFVYMSMAIFMINMLLEYIDLATNSNTGC